MEWPRLLFLAGLLVAAQPCWTQSPPGPDHVLIVGEEKLFVGSTAEKVTADDSDVVRATRLPGVGLHVKALAPGRTALLRSPTNQIYAGIVVERAVSVEPRVTGSSQRSKLVLKTTETASAPRQVKTRRRPRARKPPRPLTVDADPESQESPGESTVGGIVNSTAAEQPAKDAEQGDDEADAAKKEQEGEGEDEGDDE